VIAPPVGVSSEFCESHPAGCTCPRCPACGSYDYGDVDLAWPFGRPEHNPNPRVSLVVWVCMDCEYVSGDDM
jgi:hypothetical protein